MTRVRLDAIVDGMEMQSDTMTAYLHLPTGRVVVLGEEAFRAAETGDDEWAESDEELQDARAVLAHGDDYRALPDRFEIDEYRMMERFAAGIEDDHGRDMLQVALQGRGAFRRFKDTVGRLGIAGQWYHFRARGYEEVARAWCHAIGVDIEGPADALGGDRV